jgi:uncharacterized protein (TIGR00369 family)
MKIEQTIEFIKELFTLHIPFHKSIGMVVRELTPETVEIYLEMKPELVGNPTHQILHGGVTSAMLDGAGGLLAMASTVKQLGDSENPEMLQKRLQNLATIDIRVDYLRPGRGKWFIVTAELVRQGNKVAVTRMKMHNDEGQQIAQGTATYMVG